jgi:hypothetical protein
MPLACGVVSFTFLCSHLVSDYHYETVNYLRKLYTLPSQYGPWHRCLMVILLVAAVMA